MLIIVQKVFSIKITNSWSVIPERAYRLLLLFTRNVRSGVLFPTSIPLLEIDVE
jgi:hypothetical protein